MKIKTLVVAPYSGLKELASQLASEQEDLDVAVEHADLREAIPIIRRYEQEGIQFIISRGGTAKLIREYTNIPVVEVQVSGYDILRSLTLIKDYKQKVELIGFPNICQGVVSVAHLLDMDIPYTTIHSQDEVDGAVQLAKAHGAQVLLGDTVTVKTAEKYGLQGMMITSGRESVLDAFEQVRQINAMIAPKQPERMIQVKKIGQTTASFAQIVAHSEVMQNTIETAKAFAISSKPIIIYGEKGSGKQFMATAIHNESIGTKEGITEITIPLDPKLNDGWPEALISEDTGATIIVRGAENLAYDQQHKLFSSITNSFVPSNQKKSRASNRNTSAQRFVLIFIEHPQQLVEQGVLHPDGLALTEQILRVPSLLERKEDLDEYIKFFIGYYNSKYGKQVVGVRKEVFTYMLNRPWKENIAELKACIGQLVFSSEGYYIEEEQLKGLISDKDEHMKSVAFPIDLTKTLDEIEKDIIQYVLKEEGMNQTRAAKRLGINRTTLWRKLN